MSASASELVVDTVVIGGRKLSIVRPRDSEALLDEEAFEREEFLPYWADLWPSSVALAGVIGDRELRSARVLELGCGLALPSIVAALAGADVLATDWSPDALEFAAENARRNGVEIRVALGDWGRPETFLNAAPWDLVLASDVLYERRNVALLLELLPRLVDGGSVLLAEPGRAHAKVFLDAAGAGWQIEAWSAAELPRGAVYELRETA